MKKRAITYEGKSVRKREKVSWLIMSYSGNCREMGKRNHDVFLRARFDRSRRNWPIFDRKDRTKAVVVNGVDKTCRSSMFYPILLLNVNPSHISLPRDFDISWKSTKIPSYNGDSRRWQKIFVISVQYPYFSFSTSTFVTVVITVEQWQKEFLSLCSMW